MINQFFRIICNECAISIFVKIKLLDFKKSYVFSIDEVNFNHSPIYSKKLSNGQEINCFIFNPQQQQYLNKKPSLHYFFDLNVESFENIIIRSFEFGCIPHNVCLKNEFQGNIIESVLAFNYYKSISFDFINSTNFFKNQFFEFKYHGESFILLTDYFIKGKKQKQLILQTKKDKFLLINDIKVFSVNKLSLVNRLDESVNSWKGVFTLNF